MMSQVWVALSLLFFPQIVVSHARHMCITVDGECGSTETVSAFCSIEESDNIMSPRITSGSGLEDQPSQCYTLDGALMAIQTNDTLLLSSGTHTLRDPAVSVISNISDVSIIGNLSNHNEVIVTCEEGVGFSFVNVSGLVLSGLTVEGCSLSGSKAMVLEPSNELFSRSVIVEFYGALFLVYCSDLLVENVTVQNNRGFGIIGWNLVGDTQFRGTNFLSNSPSACTFDSEDHHHDSAGKGVGGGVFILYQDFENTSVKNFPEASLTFETGLIANNYGCRQGIGAVIFNHLFRSVIDSLSYQYLVGAGGLSIVFGQSQYHVNATVSSYTFRNNTSLYGGAGMMLLNYELANRSNTYITDTTFIENGATLRDEYGEHTVGKEGALLILFYVPIPTVYVDRSLLLKYLNQLPSKVHIRNTAFINNSAQVGGGLSTFSFGPSVSFVHDLLVLEDCTFDSNTAQHGSAIYASEITYSGFEQGLEISLHNINVTNSTGRFEAVSFNQLNVSLSGTNYFQRNRITAMSLYNAIVVFSGTSLFSNNIGNVGGAVHLETSESYIIVKNKTNVSFIANEGRIAGGAIYVEFDINSPIMYDCFLFVEDFTPFCHFFSGCSTNGIIIEFVNNTAPLGTAIHGSTLYNCPWSNGVHYVSSDNRTAHEIAQDIINSLHSAGSWLHFKPRVEQGNNVINTLPEFIVSQQLDFNLSFNVKPGGQFLLNLSAFDHLLQPVPLTILSHISTLDNDDVTTARASIGATDRYLLTGENSYTEVPISVYGDEDTSYQISITSTEASVKFDVTVNLNNCSIGFQFNDNIESLSCECEVDDYLSDITCNNDGTVTHRYMDWIGLTDSGGYIQHNCILNYCQPDVTAVDLSSPNEQCADNRAGILCGGCLPTYSRSLGSTRCLFCPNNNSLSLIIVFAILGVLLVVCIKVFNITIMDGYINGFIFYCNIVSIYFHSLPVTQLHTMTPLFTITALMNLNVGIETCFYRGMTQLDLVGLTLVFPVYLICILLAIVLFTRYCSHHVRGLLKRMKRRERKTDDDTGAANKDDKTAMIVHNKNIIHVLVTLFLLSYTNIIQTCFNILGFVTINSPSGRTVRWREDPNQKYFAGIHILLFFVAIGLILVLVPIPILLMFPRIILSSRFTHKLKPFIDAVTAPFGENRQFWLGFRLLCRLVIFFLVSFGTELYHQLMLAAILLFILTLQASIRPYKTTGRNLLDLSLTFNLTLISVITVYTQTLNALVSRYVLTAFASVAILELFFLLFYYIIVKFSFTKNVHETFILKTKKLTMRMVKHYQRKNTSFSERKSKNNDRDLRSVTANLDGRVTHGSIRLGSTASNVLREDLLEDSMFK